MSCLFWVRWRRSDLEIWFQLLPSIVPMASLSSVPWWNKGGAEPGVDLHVISLCYYDTTLSQQSWNHRYQCNKLIGRLYSYSNTTKESDCICKISAWFKQQWWWRRTWCVDEILASYPGHMVGGKSGLVSTVCACAKTPWFYEVSYTIIYEPLIFTV